ncbi:hypothetical protein PENSPDRAFT_692707 [Peniophora sp. CONT]|nr:hypothetical protein PENSPDRAFT_692707 [Peniophora sp. CONT]
MSTQATLLAEAIKLKKSAAIPLYTSPCSLTWVLHDYLLTIEDEKKYVWPSPWSFGKVLFFWVRYYTILALIFDVAQIHSFSTFQPSLNLCVWMDAIIRVVGALSLWGVEITMQLRIYALYRLSKRVAIINGVLFLGSVVGFLWILVHNGMVRASVIAQAKSLPIPGCPVVHTGIEWAQWVPATIYEGILFGFALWKAGENFRTRMRTDDRNSKKDWRPNLYEVVLSDNLLYFFFIACILTFNNLMVVGTIKSFPWFSYGPFHAATGIMTGRMLMRVRKVSVINMQGNQRTGSSDPPSLDIGSGRWQAAVVSSGRGGTGTSGHTEEIYELKNRTEHTVRILDTSDSGLANGEESEPVPISTTSTYRTGHGPDSPGNSCSVLPAAKT